MGCVTSYMAMTASTAVISNRQQQNVRRQQQQTSTGAINARSRNRTATLTSNISTIASKQVRQSAPIITSKSIPVSVQPKPKEEHQSIFTIATAATAITSFKAQPKDEILNRLLSVDQTFPETNQANRKTSIPPNPRNLKTELFPKPTNNNTQVNPSRISNQTNKRPQPNKWNKAPSATFSLTSTQSSTTNASTTSSASTSASRTTSTTSTQTEEILERLLQIDEIPEPQDSGAISIDELLGTRLDSARLLKILERKTRNSQNNIQPNVKVISKQIPPQRQVNALPNPQLLKQNGNSTKSGSKSVKPTLPKVVKSQSEMKRNSKSTTASSSRTCETTSWEYELDSKNRLYRKDLPPQPHINIPPLPQMPILSQTKPKPEPHADPRPVHQSNHYQTATSTNQSQNSIRTHFTTTSYPLTQDLNSSTSLLSSSSLTNNHHREVPESHRHHHHNHQEIFSELMQNQAPDREKQQLLNHFNRIQEYHKNRYHDQTDSMINRYEGSDSDSTISGSTVIKTDVSVTAPGKSTTSRNITFSPVEPKRVHQAKPRIVEEHKLKRHQSEDHTLIKADHLKMQQQQNHRPSVADRRRILRHAQTMPNLNYVEKSDSCQIDNHFNRLLAESRKSSKSHSSESKNARILPQIDTLKVDVLSRPATPHLPQQEHLTLPRLATASTAISYPGGQLTIPSAVNPYLRTSKSPSLTISQMSNKFESLLRHRSFLKTAASSVSSNFGRRVSELEGLGFGSSGQHVLQIINDHSTGVNCLELSEDRSLLVSGGEDGILRLWSTFSTPCECIGVLIGHTGYITCCTVYRLMVISGSADRTLKLWSIEDGNCLMTLPGHSAFINRTVCYGQLLLSSSFDGTVRVWTLTDRLTIMKSENSIENENYVEQSTSSDDDEAQDGKDTNLNKLKHKLKPANLVQRQTVKTSFGNCLHILKGHEKIVSQVAIVATDLTQLESGIIQELDIVVTTSADSTARTWNLSTGELRHVLTGHTGAINCLACDPKEIHLVYTAGADWTIKCWDVVTGEHLRDLKGHQGPIFCLVSHNRIMYSGSADHTVRAWAMEFGQCTRIYYRNTSSVTCIQYLNGIVYTGSNDHSARLYDSNSGVLKQTFSGHENAISAMKAVPGKLFTASFDGRIIVWDCHSVQKDIDVNGGNLNGNTNQQSSSIEQSRSNSKSHHHSRHSSSQPEATFIGATMLNHTLELFPDGKPMQQSRETLYPALAKKSPHESTHDRLVSDAIQQAVSGRRRSKRKTTKDRKLSRRDSSDSEKSQSGCFGAHRIWPEKFSLSSSSSARKRQSLSLSQAKGNLFSWSNANDSNNHAKRNKRDAKGKKGKKTKVKRRRDQVAPGGGRGQPGGEMLNQSIRALIQPTDEYDDYDNQNNGATREGHPLDDSVNVRRAIDALEPYLRSFK